MKRNEKPKESVESTTKPDQAGQGNKTGSKNNEGGESGNADIRR